MQTKSINTLWIKISGKLNVDVQFELSSVVEFVGRGEVVKKEIRDNQDGTVDITFMIKPTVYEFKLKP